MGFKRKPPEGDVRRDHPLERGDGGVRVIQEPDDPLRDWAAGVGAEYVPIDDDAFHQDHAGEVGRGGVHVRRVRFIQVPGDLQLEGRLPDRERRPPRAVRQRGGDDLLLPLVEEVHGRVRDRPAALVRDREAVGPEQEVPEDRDHSRVHLELPRCTSRGRPGRRRAARLAMRTNT